MRLEGEGGDVSESDPYDLVRDVDAERAVLGSMLLDAAAVHVCRTIIRSGSEFTNERLSVLWDCILEMSDSNRPIDGVLIRDELVRRNLFEQIGGYSLLKDLVSSVGSSHRAADYARIVHEHHIRRRATSGATDLLRLAESGADVGRVVASAADLYEHLAELNVAAASGDGGVNGWLDDDLVAVFDGKKTTNAIPSGFFELDEMTGGLQRGCLTVIAARPSHGKTSLAHNIADRVCVTDGNPAIFFSLEMTVKALLWQWAASRSLTNGWLLRRGIQPRTNDLEYMKQAVSDIYRAPLQAYGTRLRDLDSIVNLTRLGVRRKGVRVVFVDYLSLILIRGRFDRNDLRVGHGVATLKSLAGDLDIAVVLLCQLNREREKGARPPMLSDLRDSGEIEQHTDVVIFPHQRAEFGDMSKRMQSGPAELIVAKNRVGPTGTVEVEFKAFCTKFTNPSVGGEV